MENKEKYNITDYMERLAIQEWKTFEWAYTKSDLLYQLSQIKKMKKSSRNYQTEHFKRCLDACGIRTDRIGNLLSTESGINQLKERIENSVIPEDTLEIEKKLFEMMHNMYREFPAAGNFMERLVKDPNRGLADEEFKSDSVRVAILKQFMKYTSYNTAGIKKIIEKNLKEKYKDQKSFDINMIISNIDESIFDELKDNTKLPLLKLADDLASGKFRTNGRTRKDLYMFAFAFGMTSSFGRDDLDYDPNTDIEKNLFQDYYNDNLLRYISDSYKEDARRYEAEPSGAGINYKNFAEVIYLYYLNQNGMSAKEKIKQAEALIKECVTEGQAIKNNEESYQKTQFFQDICDKNQIVDLNRDDFKEFIRSNYKIPSGNRSASDITVDNETRTARDELSSIYNDTVWELYPDFSSEQMLENDYRIAIQEILADHRDDQNFVSLIRHLDQKFNIRKKLMAIKENKDVHVTRADLIAAGFYYFQLNVEDEKIISLQETYEEFSDFINPHLIRSRFQEINTKNIFDMYVIAALYQAVNFS